MNVRHWLTGWQEQWCFRSVDRLYPILCLASFNGLRERFVARKPGRSGINTAATNQSPEDDVAPKWLPFRRLSCYDTMIWHHRPCLLPRVIMVVYWWLDRKFSGPSSSAGRQTFEIPSGSQV